MITRIIQGEAALRAVVMAGLLVASGSVFAQSGVELVLPVAKQASRASNAPGYQRVELMPVTPAQAEAAVKAWRRPAGLISPALSPVRTDRAGEKPAGQDSLRASGDNAAVGPASLDELARALKNDPDLIYEYVRNNIEYYPVWGVQKGALGAVMDNQGTAFDQAMLMVELLRRAGYTASVVKGEINLTPAMVQEWLGIDVAKACPVVMRFRSGSVPITNVNNNISISCPSDLTTTLSSIRVGHVWVSATISGTAYVFDPSYKPHTLKSGLNVPTIANYSQTTFLERSRIGSTSSPTPTPIWVQGLNRTNIRADLSSMAVSLSNHVRQNLPNGTIDDLVGGRTITPKAAGNLRQTSLAYQVSSPAPVVLADAAIDAYRPTLQVQYAGIDKTFTSDAIYGRRLTITYNASDRAVLSLDGSVVQTGNVVASGAMDSVTLSVVHSGYASGSANRSWPQPIKAGAGYTYLISNGWGPMGRGTIDKFRTQLDGGRASGAADGSEAVLGSALGVLSATWIAQADHNLYLIDKLAKTNTVMHHRFGIAGYNGSAYVDLPGNLSSPVSESGDSSKETAAFYAFTMHSSILESTAVQQTMGNRALSTVKLIDIAASDPTIRLDLFAYKEPNTDTALIDMIFGSAYPPQLGLWMNCAQGFVNTLKARISNPGDSVIVPRKCPVMTDDGPTIPGQPQWKGSGWFAIKSAFIGAEISGNLLGGFSAAPQTQSAVANAAFALTNSPWSLTQFTGFSFGDPIDMTKGHYLYSHDDINVGVGAFPYSLGFQRLYSSGARLKGGVLGRGWTHNLNASLALGSDGFQAMGEDSALDAAATVVEMMVSLDLLSDPAKPLDKMVIATIAQRWFGDQLQDNTVVVTQGLNSEVFVKLPDGSYNPPPGSSARLTKEADGSFTYETVHRNRLKFNALGGSATSGKLSTYTLANGVQAKFTYTGGHLTKVENSLGRQLNLVVSGDRIDSVNDGNGRSVSYTYTGTGLNAGINANLTGFTDAESKTTTYEYDSTLTGAMTKLFYPSRPTVAFMDNVYDTLGRVKTQKNAVGKTYTYYFAGSRSEEVGPAMASGGNASNVSYLDGMGRVQRALDPTGRVTVNTHDGAGRIVKVLAPEGNSIEYTYDDATCAAADKRCTHNVKTLTRRPKPGSPLTALTSSVIYETAFNKPSSSTNARNKTTNYTYHSHGELHTVEGPADPSGVRPKTIHTYVAKTPAGWGTFYLPETQTRKISASVDVQDKTTYEDTKKYVPKTSSADFGSGKLNLTTTYVYDAIGNLQSVDGPRADVTDVTSFVYDNERRLKQTTDALGRVSKTRYDADGRPERVAAQAPGANTWLVSCTSYTATGKPSRSWGPALLNSDTACPTEDAPTPIVDTAYDELDRPWKVTQYLTAAEGGNRISETLYFLDGKVKNIKRGVDGTLAQTYASYTYTANGLPETLTDAKSFQSRYEYDGLDRLAKLRYPNPASTDTASSTDYEGYGYDDNDNLTSHRRRSGQSITLTYDNLDRLNKRVYPSAADNVEYTLDLLGRRKAAAYSNATHSLAWEWDNAGRLKSATAGGKVLAYEYDAAGNRTRITWPETTPFYVTTEYDALNRPTKVKQMGSATAVLADYSGYDELSRRSTVTLGNGSSTSYSYGAQGALSGLSHNLSGSAQDVSYGYGRNQALEINAHSWSNNAYQWQPTFDRNRVYTVNGLNQYKTYGPGVLAHDSGGNVSGDGLWTWGYDTDNRLKSATRSGVNIQLSYDAAGRMRQESVTTGSTTSTQYLYDGTDLVAEYDGAGNLLRRYVHGPGIDEPLVAYEGSGTTARQWLYADHLGSVVARADSGGNATTTQGYGPFGEPGAAPVSRFGYTGQVFMPNLGLYYYKARFYAPGIGRFLQTDPIGYADDLNLYTYVGNNPINATDPSGEFLVQAGMFLLGGGIDIAAQMLIEKKSWAQVSRIDAALSGGAAVLTGNVAGRLAQAAYRGTISVGQAVGYTAATGAAAGATVSALSEMSKGNAPDPIKMAIGAIGGGAGAGAGARVANAAASRLATLSKSGGVSAGIAATTRSATNFGSSMKLGGGLGEEAGKFVIDAAAAGLGKWAEQSLTGSSTGPGK